MKKILFFAIQITVSLLAACGTMAVPTPVATSIPLAGSGSTSAPVALTWEDGLLYVREEEKLAHDVYAFLYEQWDLQTFKKIASSEQIHTDEIRSLLAAYSLPDPAAETNPGHFANPDLQALYDELTAQGSQSLADALKVGAVIEEIDILDLQAHLSGDLPDDVRLVYENLLSGSYNHLASFTSTLLKQTGETYLPQYMTAEAYREALNLAKGGGIGNGQGQGGRP